MTVAAFSRLLSWSMALLAGAWAPAQSDPPEQEAAAPAAQPPRGGRIAILLREGDESYRRREEAGQAERAIEAWQKALALDPKNAEACWRIARAHYWLGGRAERDSERGAIYKRGIDYAKMGVAADDASVASHFWLGVMYGAYGQAVGIMQSLHMVEPIEQEMKTVLARDETFDEGGAHRVLGRLYAKLPSFKGGDRGLARRHLERAIELGPQNTLNYLFLAELLLDEGDKTGAREALEKLLRQPDDPDYLPETKEQKAKARTILDELARGRR
jgi:tetratricopeptide (TPR) repeat protein